LRAILCLWYNVLIIFFFYPMPALEQSMAGRQDNLPQLSQYPEIHGIRPLQQAILAWPSIRM
ncbi:MAG: hypothetical protein FWE31_06105, partial [Firmicutes bacterium]|nr:hypothetical protein [Bacillota bacterium]